MAAAVPGDGYDPGWGGTGDSRTWKERVRRERKSGNAPRPERNPAERRIPGEGQVAVPPVVVDSA